MTYQNNPNPHQAWSQAAPTETFTGPLGYSQGADVAGDVGRKLDTQRPPLADDRRRDEPASTPLPDMFRLSALWTEVAIVSVVVGVLYGMIVWVADLLATRISDQVDGTYLPMVDPAVYAVRGVIFAVIFAVAAVVMVGLHRAVNNPGAVFGWLFAVVALWAAIVLLTNPLWQSVPEMALLLIGAAIIFTIIPPRVGAYRTAAPRLR